MRRPRPIATTRAIVRNLAAERRARATYKALCDRNRAPLVSVRIRLETDHGDDWTGMRVHGIYGQTSEHIPLTPAGIRYITGIAKTIRRTCLDELRYDERQRAEEEAR